jgi:hypothetical protein
MLLPRRDSRLLNEFALDPIAEAGMVALGRGITLMNEPDPVGDSGEWTSVGVRSPVDETPLNPCLARCWRCRLRGVALPSSLSESCIDSRGDATEGELGEARPEPPNCKDGMA